MITIVIGAVTLCCCWLLLRGIGELFYIGDKYHPGRDIPRELLGFLGLLTAALAVMASYGAGSLVVGAFNLLVSRFGVTP